MYQGYLIDLDGTLYNGTEPIPSARLFIERLRAESIPFMLVTNNATRSIQGIQDNLLNNFDIQVSQDEIYTSALAVLDYLGEYHSGDNVFVIGEDSLKNSIKEAGFEVVSDLTADVVVQALQTDVTYEELANAVMNINRGAVFLVTNEDRLIPTGQGMKPSSGATTAFLNYATQVEPKVFGKPNEPLLKGALDRLGINPSEVAMIGDNYETDIMFGINGGLDTILVLTGVTKEEEVTDLPIAPQYVINNLSEWDLKNHG